MLEVPYFNKQTLIVAASLTGGNIAKTFVTTLLSWLSELGMPCPSTEELYTTLISKAQERMFTSLQMDTRLWGERHAPNQRGAMGNISEDNVSIGDIGSALFRGIVENLHSMMTAHILQQLQV